MHISVIAFNGWFIICSCTCNVDINGDCKIVFHIHCIQKKDAKKDVCIQRLYK